MIPAAFILLDLMGLTTDADPSETDILSFSRVALQVAADNTQQNHVGIPSHLVAKWRTYQ
ncbi:hypothetical protein OUZ56_029981 [Daphnia magna]|uniref:Uncharacterized protein n=1 Tax=Daphnia magna TaxID=35525 RepID=A0ABR0B8C8_9CRUS|nr:hypothetical protein OUZ56_029981 [Daphnia magna]